MNQTYYGDVLTVLPQLIEQGVKVNMCVTSPPYWGLRQYLPTGSVILRHDLDDETRNKVEAELVQLGIKPRS